MVYQFRLRWETPNADTGYSVLHAATGADALAFITTLEEVWDDIDVYFAAGVRWTSEESARVLDTATGELISMETFPAGGTGVGASAAAPVPNASQLLVRLLTGDVKRGRMVRGRWFLPGLATSATVGGEVAPAAASALNGALNFPGVVENLVVWSRPAEGSPGSMHSVGLSPVWNELAVLRSRR